MNMTSSLKREIRDLYLHAKGRAICNEPMDPVKAQRMQEIQKESGQDFFSLVYAYGLQR